MMKFAFWLTGSESKLARSDELSADTKCVTSNESIVNHSSTNQLKVLFTTLIQDPESKKSLEICDDPIIYKKVNPSSWITAAKQHPFLFSRIIERPQLAAWVNHFPTYDPQGLLLIATFTNTHLLLAQQYLEATSETDNVFSVDQRKAIQNAYAHCGFTI